jgi:hypothetical protein
MRGRFGDGTDSIHDVHRLAREMLTRRGEC